MAKGFQVSNTLSAVLSHFQGDVNGNPRLKNLLKGWNPSVVLDALDTGRSFTLKLDEGCIADVETGKHERPHSILIQSTEEVLGRVFSGRLNPARAVLDGDLAVFGSDKDQVKLDAISLVLWGL